ncbi:RNA 3'-terminal phosphate cyclase [Pseudomonas aeruginosa]|nr:RNA 3'-terminal phosphate cyclase [Pseudomonas aeruginosa]
MRKDLIELDGSEGGGQILRSALSLSMTSGQPLRIRNIRGRRSRPGLLRQHLTAVRAAAEICAAEVEGAELGSRELAFRPGAIRAGDYAFAIGSAGSCSLVLQTLLPALLAANGESRGRISGGTHNPLAPPADFLRDSWLPLLQRMGAEVDLELLRHGFVPAGGGELLARVRPARWRPLQLEQPGAALRRQARALLAGIPGHVGERELERVRQRLGWSDEERQLEFLAEDHGPGNALLLRIDCEHICAIFCAFGQAGVSAERVAEQVATQAIGWMESGCAADEHLADQLLLPMALAGAGSFTTPRLSAHLQSNRRVIERFLPVRIGDQALDGGGHRIVITSA